MGNIAIDGPAGAGKSSISKRVAKELGFIYVDTGALYRAIGCFVTEKNVDYLDEEAVGKILNECLIKIGRSKDAQTVSVNGVDITDKLRTEEIGNVASKVSAYAKVREKLLSVQRDIARDTNVVMDGRDIGTVVLPDAMLKVYLTASVEERTKRRILQLEKSGEKYDVEKIKEDIINRDNQDMTREIAPLKKAEDAVLLDSSDMTIDEVVNEIISLYRKKEKSV